MMMMGVSGMTQNPVLSKLNEDHIHKLLDNSESESVREDRQSRFDRVLAFVAFIVFLVFIVGILFFLVLQDEVGLLGQILGALVVFGGGFSGGFGVGKLGR